MLFWVLTTKICFQMLPHSLSVVVTSFTRGISAEVIISSSLHTQRSECHRTDRMCLDQCEYGWMDLPSLFNNDFLQLYKAGWKCPLTWRREVYMSEQVIQMEEVNVRYQIFTNPYFSILVLGQITFVPTWNNKITCFQTVQEILC